MDAAVIRLKLPAGAAFIAAFDDAADKYASRRGFGDGGALFTQLTSAAVRAVAAASPSTIELVAREHTDQIVAVVRGHEPTGTIPAADIGAVTGLSASLAAAPSVDASTAVIEFTLPLN